MRRSFGPIVTISIMISTAAIAAQAQKPQSNDPNRIVCRAQDKTGSRIGSAKICMTAGQWEQMRLADRDMLDRMEATARDTQAGGMGMGGMGGMGMMGGPH